MDAGLPFFASILFFFISPPDQIRPVMNIWHWASDPPVAASKSEYLSVLCPLCAQLGPNFRRNAPWAMLLRKALNFLIGH
jgi:hypothetical protein